MPHLCATPPATLRLCSVSPVDITGRKGAEDELREKHAQLQTALDTGPDGRLVLGLPIG